MACSFVSLGHNEAFRRHEYFHYAEPRHRHVALDVGTGLELQINAERLDQWEQLAAEITEACRRLRESLNTAASAGGTDSAGSSLSEGQETRAAAKPQEA